MDLTVTPDAPHRGQINPRFAVILNGQRVGTVESVPGSPHGAPEPYWRAVNAGRDVPVPGGTYRADRAAAVAVLAARDRAAAARADESGLTTVERAVLDLEAAFTFSTDEAAKDAAIRTAFGWTWVTYWPVLNGLLDNPHAEAYAPMVVNRHRRLREQRRQVRSVASVIAGA